MSEPVVHGVDLDAETRCAHWHSPLDVIAIRASCCGEYYACADCHAALADHALVPWPRDERDMPAVLCGVCRTELGIDEYLTSGHTCPHCGASFNPRCSLHHHQYFAP